MNKFRTIDVQIASFPIASFHQYVNIRYSVSFPESLPIMLFQILVQLIKYAKDGLVDFNVPMDHKFPNFKHIINLPLT